MGARGTSQETIDTAGIRWHLAPGAAEILNASTLDLAIHQRSGAAQVVKSGPHRTVYRIALPAGVVFWKHCRIAGIRSWLRQCLRPPKAKMEFDRAIALAARGIATIEPLAWGIDHHKVIGESYLITRELVGAESLSHYLEQIAANHNQPRKRRAAAVALGQFFAQLHEAGVVHPDLHAGNILVASHDEQARFHLIDLHDIRLGKPLAWAARRDNLVVFNRWFVDHASRSDRCRFWNAYVAATSNSSMFPDDAALDVERRTLESNLAFRAGRDRRCMGSNRYFQKVRSHLVKGLAVRDIDESLLQRLLADPDQPFRDPAAILLKDSRTSTVAEITVDTPNGPKRYIWKRFCSKKPFTGLINLYRSSPALRAWQAGFAFYVRGLPTPRPLLLLHRRGLLGAGEGYLLCEKIDDALDLLRANDALAKFDCNRQRMAIASLARLVRDMHDLRLSHRDLKAANVLWTSATDSFSFIDLVGVAMLRHVPALVKMKNLARLNLSFTQSPYLTRTDRLRFLRTYLCWGLRGREGWKFWWKGVADASQVKVEQNQRRGRPVA